MGYIDLESYYRINFTLMHVHKYSLTELEAMIPFEREIYLTMLIDYQKQKEQEHAERRNK